MLLLSKMLSYLTQAKLHIITGLKDQEMEKIRTNLFENFYVRVDGVKHGSGTSLNGNTARTCFKDPMALATVLGTDGDLVKRLSFVLLAFKRKEGVDMDILQKYCTETYKLFFKLYPWAKLNPSVHKMLRHGVDIARNFPLSLAYFAEDAAESMHKCYRKSSVSHARQNSRENRLKDVFNRAVDMSDPVISLTYLEKRIKTKKRPLPSDFISLFELTDYSEDSDACLIFFFNILITLSHFFFQNSFSLNFFMNLFFFYSEETFFAYFIFSWNVKTNFVLNI